MVRMNNPVPSGKMRICINMLKDVHVKAKKVTQEDITRLGAIIGLKRKREDGDEGIEGKIEKKQDN